MKQKRKKNSPRFQKVNPFPVRQIPSLNDQHTRAIGIFNGLCIEVASNDHIIWLYDNGNYGTGAMSRSTPKALLIKKDHSAVVSDTTNQETLVLFLEEAFFLQHCLRVLIVEDEQKRELQSQELWSLFIGIKPDFIESFVAYVYFKSLNWVIKCGLKFGGEFLLYKKGPRYYHANYVVRVRRAGTTDTLKTTELQGLHRVAETAGKEFLLLDVYFPKIDCPQDDLLQHLDKFTVSEMIPKRFNFNQERATTSV